MPGITHPNSRWNDKTDAVLRRLWKEGLSASQIALEMASGLTRNMVIGRANRLKLPARIPGRHTPKPPPPRQRKKPKAQRVTLPPLPINGPVLTADTKLLKSAAWLALPGTEPKTLTDLKADECRWPIGENPTLFCGCATEKTYCPTHAKRARRPFPEKVKK